MEAVIEVSGLHKTYRMGMVDYEVLRDISLSIDRGEFVAIMGPSGSGKSTLLYLLGGLEKPTQGSVKIKGKELSSMGDLDESRMRRRDIGFVFQFYNLILNLTVEENVLLPILLDGKNARDYTHKVEEILTIVGLAHRRKHTPRELSGGQQQRVAIARALINDPDILLADEPIGNLDTKTGTEIMELLQRINAEKQRTIVMVTHSTESANYGNRIVHMKDGRVVT